MGKFAPFLLFAVILTAVTIAKPYKNGPAIRSDGVGYHLWTNGVKKWDFRFCEYRDILSSLRPIEDRCVNKYAPGVALFRLPIMIFLNDPSNVNGFSKGEHAVSLIFGALLTAGVFAFALASLRQLGVGWFEAQAIIFILMFGTGLFHYGTYDNSFTHIYSAFGTAFLVWQLARLMAGKVVLARRELALTALTAFFMVLFRNTNVFILGFYGLMMAAFSRSWTLSLKAGMAVALGIVVGASLQLFYNYYAIGQFSLSSYSEEGFNWNDPMMWSVLFSYERGLFTYYPVVLFGLLFGVLRRPFLKFNAWTLAIVLFYAAFYGYWHSWFLGAGFGHRGFVELVPFLILAWGEAIKGLSRRRARQVLLGGALIGTITMQVMVGYWRGTFPYTGASSGIYWGEVLNIEGLGIVLLLIAFFAWRARREPQDVTTAGP